MRLNPGSGQGRLGRLLPCSCTPCPQWPYCEKRCSYCNFNKYIPRGVEEAAMRSCLVTEAQTLLQLSGVRRWVLAAVGGSWELSGGVNRAGADIPERSPGSHLLHPLSSGWTLCSLVGAPPVWPVPTLWLLCWRQWPRQPTCLQTQKSHWRSTRLRPQAPGWQPSGQQESTGCPLASR